MSQSSPVAADLLEVPDQPAAVLRFWQEAGPALWFAKDAAFDLRFRDTFADAYAAAAACRCHHWAARADGALALILLLDQYPRNAFRNTPRMYATDALARDAADVAIGVGHDLRVDPAMRLFFYMPFAHSEDLADQDRSVTLMAALGPDAAKRAVHHRDIIARFGQFPHRNAILGRASTPEETAWLKAGGYAG